LVAAINNLPTNIPNPNINLSTITFSSGKYVYTDINLLNQKIVFDANGNSDAQFFIMSNSQITFNNIQTIELKGKVKNLQYFFNISIFYSS
jgi:hypothetical protein